MQSDSFEFQWIDPDYVVEINAALMEASGEPHQVLSRNALEGAVARARNAYVYGEIRNPVHLAIRLMVGVAKGHPFEQGNKRTGFMAAAVFLETNGILLTIADNPSLFADTLIDVIEGRATEDELAALYIGALA